MNSSINIQFVSPLTELPVGFLYTAFKEPGKEVKSRV